MSDAKHKQGHSRPRRMRPEPPLVVASMMDDYMLPGAAIGTTGRQSRGVWEEAEHQFHRADWRGTLNVEPIVIATRRSVGSTCLSDQSWFTAGMGLDMLMFQTRVHFAWDEVESAPGAFVGTGTDLGLQSTFEELAAQWKKDVRFESSVEKMAMHPAYQRIIGLGPSVISLVLEALSAEADHWFWALQALTGENPVSESSAGNIKLMAGEWQEWASDHGY